MNDSDHIYIPVSAGELFDKLSILSIKLEEIKDEQKLKHVRAEFDLLENIRKDRCPWTEELERLYGQMKEINKVIWDQEDIIRDCFKKGDESSDVYVIATTTAHKNNDERMRIKKLINELLGSTIREEKSHM
jgi:hypothetical protein